MREADHTRIRLLSMTDTADVGKLLPCIDKSTDQALDRGSPHLARRLLCAMSGRSRSLGLAKALRIPRNIFSFADAFL